MNFFSYIESKFVTSQVGIQNKSGASATGSLAENHALRTLMWIALKVMTALQFFWILAHYLAVLLHLVARPRPAGELAREAQEAVRNAQTQQADLARKVSEDLLKAGTKQLADAGLDADIKRGTA